MKRLLPFILFLVSCTDTTLSPSNVEIPSPTTGASASNSAPASFSPDEPTDVEVIGLNRAGVRVSTSCGGSVTFYVPAANASYVNVWLPAVNDGSKHGPFPVNEEFSLDLPPGDYQFQLAVELRRDDGLIQDDRHRGSFTIASCPPPPRTPEEPEDVCPNLRGVQETVPDGLVLDEQGNCVEPESECEQDCEEDPEDPPEDPPEETCETNPDLCPEEEHGACFYEVAGKKDEKQAYCESVGGTFSTHDNSDHCVFVFPGIADSKLNLAPGLSDPDCLRKQDN